MADYFTVFSTQVVLRKGRHVIDAVKDILNKGTAARQALCEAEVWEGLDECGFDFEWTWHADDTLTIQSEENGNVEHVVAFLETLVKRNLAREPVVFYWANTCSSMRLDEFSGGGALVTKEKTYWFVPSVLVGQTWARIQRERRARAMPKRKKRRR